jgi:hypothetical protein
MTRSRHIKRFATVAAVAGAMTVVVPVAQAGYDPKQVADSVETSLSAQRTPELSQPGYGNDRIADSVESARAAQQRIDLGTSSMPDVVDRAVTAHQQTLDLSQPGYGNDRVADSIDTARTAQARDFGTSSMPDLVDRAVIAHQAEIASQSSPPDVLERTAAAGPGQYYFQPSESSGFHWGDFGIGAGAGIGLMLLLGTLGAGLHVTRRQVRTA